MKPSSSSNTGKIFWLLRFAKGIFPLLPKNNIFAWESMVHNDGYVTAQGISVTYFRPSLVLNNEVEPDSLRLHIISRLLVSEKVRKYEKAHTKASISASEDEYACSALFNCLLPKARGFSSPSCT
jgi:hypothetical protein